MYHLYLYKMNIFRLAFELFALYILYKLIFDFIIPVIKTTKVVKQQFGDMSARMQETMKQQQQANSTVNANAKPAAATTKNEDYIEFEEIPPSRNSNFKSK